MTDASQSANSPEADDAPPSDGVNLTRTLLGDSRFGSPRYDPSRDYSIAFQPQPQMGPGLLGSLEDIKAAIAEAPPSDPSHADASDYADDGDGPILSGQAVSPLGLDPTLPRLDIPPPRAAPASAPHDMRSPSAPTALAKPPPAAADIDASRRRNGAVVVIGGGGDSMSHIGSDYANGRYPGSQYVGHFQWQFDADGVLKRVQARARGAPIIVVGHSWGAPAAYDLANRLRSAGSKVAMLVTADPVSSLPAAPAPKDVPWVNITATPQQWDQSDWIAGAGGKPSQLPTEKAQLNGAAPVHHYDLPGMMSHPIAGGLSAEDMIDRILAAGQGGR